MKRILSALLALLLLSLMGCNASAPSAQLACTTLPVYEFTSRLCRDTGITVTRLITQEVSCLHDYSLRPTQMRSIEYADAVILSGAGLEDCLADALCAAVSIIDASAGLHLHHSEHDGHDHGSDPHIWLAPENAKHMAQNICSRLIELYPEKEALLRSNLTSLLADLDALQSYGQSKLQNLTCRQLITFHDGFSYLAEAFDLEILKAVEEESGSEASAATLVQIIALARQHHIPAIFTENNGATAAAEIISRETGIPSYCLDMVISGESYFDAMYRNIDTLWEALQ